MVQPDSAENLRNALTAQLRQLERPGDTPDLGCLDFSVIAALADGSLSQKDRVAAIVHLADCAPCRRTLASVARTLADRSVAREVRAVEAVWRRRLLRVALPAAVAAALLLIVMPWPAREDGPNHRAPTITAVDSPTPRSPVGIVANAALLRWAPVSGSDRYRVVLFDGAGRVLFEIETADTLLAVPDSVPLTPGRPYLWRVEARTGFDRWSESALIEFTIGGGPAR